jgi:hypothetical protein
MRAAYLMGLMFLTPLVVQASDKTTPLDVKTGLWEITFTSSVKGEMPVDPELLKKMTAEQRARLEQIVKAQQAKGAQTRTQKTCLTAEKLKKDPFIEAAPNCTRTVVTSSSSEINVREQCSSNGEQQNTSYDIRAVTPENVKGTMRVEDTGNNKTLDISGDFSGRWIAPACAGVD